MLSYSVTRCSPFRRYVSVSLSPSYSGTPQRVSTLTHCIGRLQPTPTIPLPLPLLYFSFRSGCRPPRPTGVLIG